MDERTSTITDEIMCDCISYNQPDPKCSRPEVVFPCPPHMLSYVSENKQRKGICIDECIVDAIKMLWANQVHTLGCCCGHGNAGPSLVIHENEDAERVKALLQANDARDWEVLQWRLVTC